MAPLHRRAARWYERNGQLTDAVRHAAQASDWPLASRMVIDGLPRIRTPGRTPSWTAGTLSPTGYPMR